MAGGVLVYLTVWRDREIIRAVRLHDPIESPWARLELPRRTRYCPIQVEAVERFGVPIINASDRNELHDFFHCAPLGPGA
jgi:hypothetical protein